MNSNLKIGTCSWKYDSWKGLIYPDFGEFNYLSVYSKKFNTVEIDQWFWSLYGDKIKLPSPKTVEEYISSVPEDFKFTIKVPNSISLTHQYRSNIKNNYFLSPKLMNSFTNSIIEMGNNVGCLMIQFEYLNKDKMPSYKDFENKISNFIKNINSTFKIGIETRNPNYLSERYFAILKDLNVIPVLSQGYYMPDITKVYGKYKSLLNNCVFRLLGFDRQGIEIKTKKIWNEIVDPKNQELERIAHMITEVIGNNNEIYINVNNHYEGSAPLTIERLNEFL